MSHNHHQQAAKIKHVEVSVVTVSDTRTAETDTSGAFLREAIVKAGHKLKDYQLIRDEPDQVVELLDRSTAQAIVFTGGTGISTRDTTYDALAGRLEKVLPGFGELFRMLSYEEIGAAAMASRAVAGTYQGRLIFSTPGSTAAVRLAWTKLIAPELRHLVHELNR